MFMFNLFRSKPVKTTDELISEHCKDKNVIKVKQLSENVHMVIYLDTYFNLQFNADIMRRGVLVPLNYQIGIYVIKEDNDYWAIGQIRIYHDQINNGLGTILVQELIEFARKEGAKYLVGNMSVGEDDEHASRLRHFYTKLGFTLKGYAFKMKL